MSAKSLIARVHNSHPLSRLSNRGFTLKMRSSASKKSQKRFTFKTHSVTSEKSRMGFTLIELLIVVAIIAVLVGVGSVSFTTARRQGRDAQRKADLAKVASALEQYFADNTSYPGEFFPAGEIQCGVPIDNKVWGTSFTCVYPTDTKVYLQELPSDPSLAAGNLQYFYDPQDRSGVGGCTEPFCQQFILEADLEQTPNPADLDCTPVNRNYCVVSPGFE